MSNIKLVDILSFSGNHVKLGSPIFKMKDGLHKRLFFEYSDKAFMLLNYDSERERIIYDHLSPESPTMEGLYEYYVPDLSYDELKFVNNKWLLQENVVGVNGKESKSYDLYHIDDKSGKVVKTHVKNKWIDPSDGNAPAGPNVHVAKLPEDDINDKKKSETENINQESKINKKNSKSEFSMNPFLKKKRK